MAARVESRFTVPAATTISVSSGALTAAVPVTWTSGNYYATSAGGVSSGPSILTAAINAAVTGLPDNAAAMATCAGGTWSSGWSFQIASGNDTGMFGGVTLTAVGTPTYRTAGPAQGTDYAVGFDSDTDAFSGGNNFNPGATDDLAIAWVAKFSAQTVDTYQDWISKSQGSATNYQLYATYSAGTTTLTFTCFIAGVPSTSSVTLTAAFNEVWHVGMAVVDRSTGKVRLGLRTLDGLASTTYGSEATIAASSLASAGDFLVGDSADVACKAVKFSAIYIGVGSGYATGLSAGIASALSGFASAALSAFTVSVSTTDGRTTISNSFWTYSLTWTSTTARDLLGFAGNITSQTTEASTKQAKGIWFSGSPLSCDEHPSMYPDETDTRGSESPTGVVLGLSGNVKYVHTNVGFERCAVSQIREASATYANGSLETFFRDAISGQGHAWFRPLSPLQVYWSNQGTDSLLGGDASSSTGVAGWSPVGISKFRELAVPSQRNWVGQWDVRFPRLVSSG